MRMLPPLNAVRTFECAARHLSFTKAAEELCVTPGAVSRAIAGLEERLQTPLFSQHKRRLQLTAAGRAYLFHVTQALDRLSLGTDELLQHRGEGGLLTIGALPTLGSRWLIPKLQDFQRRYPNISVEVKTTPSDFSKAFTELDLNEHGLDVALYIGQGDWSGVRRHKLFPERLLPVAAPSLREELEALGRGEADPGRLLLHSTRPHVWAHWFEAQGFDFTTPTWRARFEHYYMVIEAAMHGLGVALLPEVLVAQELRSGALLALSERDLPQAENYYLLHHPARSEENKIRAFRDWLMRTEGARENPVLKGKSADVEKDG
ncbi:LysR substrate-binding domain-containing protein [Hahella aquimaris]|uniref:LysR substrate-binding domain-containing protein n=1 Tax=Hahella sp. HNIBRBA332 TaxID=3015983 RepID=UPI00273C998C|nr:LysR substrate-binding domain-containing protein [Hahella sp. HNIBRBA332]WLQ13351.1 LysR substrate-binding domain-containing protein [Hahella sp. HNIBRBA332]